MNAKTQNTRQHILDCGYQLIAGRGFSSVGLSEILTNAAVPKGFFYHYFKSKEQFGRVLLERYFQNYREDMRGVLDNTAMSGRDRLLRYWQFWMKAQTDNTDRKCLVVKLGAEVADLSEAMRHTLQTGTNQIVEQLADGIVAAIEDGSVRPLEARKTATLLYQIWLGASLMSKFQSDSPAMTAAMESTEALLPPP